jgi:hypothetical protein
MIWSIGDFPFFKAFEEGNRVFVDRRYSSKRTIIAAL